MKVLELEGKRMAFSPSVGEIKAEDFYCEQTQITFPPVNESSTQNSSSVTMDTEVIKYEFDFTFKASKE